ncbi:MAG: DMT family transporter [Victivallaceae bacterium]|nr:DMT family transporter [Victivallaceae bacterium]
MKNYLYIALAVVAWSFEYILIKAVAQQVSPLLSGAIIFVTAAICLYGFILFTHQQSQSATQISGNLSKIVLIGIIGTGCNILWISGTGATAVANAAVLGRTDILFSLVLAVAVFHEKIRKRALLFVPLILFGLFLLLRQQFGQVKFGNSGDYMILGSAFLLSLNAFIIKHSMKDVSGATLALGNCLINSFIFIVIQFFYQPGNFFTGCDYRTVGLLALCGGCSFIFFIGYYKSLKLFPVWEVRLLTLMVPVLVAFIGYIVFNATINLAEFSGGIFILLGAGGIIIFNNKINFNLQKKRTKKYVEI